LRTLCTFLILAKFSKFQTVSRGCPPSQQHTFSAGLLFDETFAQTDVFAVANCPVAALSVFHSAVIMRSLIFLHLWTPLTYSTESVLLPCFNGKPD